MGMFGQSYTELLICFMPIIVLVMDSNIVNDSTHDQEDAEIEESAIIDYKKSENYWSTVPPTVDGMLGGFADVSSSDIKASADFINKLHFKGHIKNLNLALDCGAGIGRVSKLLLLQIFKQVCVSNIYILQYRYTLELDNALL